VATKPSPAKVGVDCPHCGFKQMEYAAAKSTMCRQCGAHFVPSAPKVQLRLRQKDEAPPEPAADTSFLRIMEGFWAKHHRAVIECFDCKATQEVSTAAHSTICPKCSKHIDLRDYKITTSFSRSIRTNGQVHLTAKGDLSSSNVVCRSALIEGKLRGNLQCLGRATINFVGKIPGRLTAEHILVERKSVVQFFRRVRVKTIEIRGRMTGEVIAQGTVIIHRNATLDGNVTAKSISVERGGIFNGQLIIGSEGLTQAELLPQRELLVTEESSALSPAVMPQPLPAT
jgi:cytoskeletal protein CcmA (bactofilin family)/Zn finger protein HypA/HybF involved in hydrogenase expression